MLTGVMGWSAHTDFAIDRLAASEGPVVFSCRDTSARAATPASSAPLRRGSSSTTVFAPYAGGWPPEIPAYCSGTAH